MQGMTMDDTAEVNAIVEEQIQANMGMAMIYAIVSALQEWLIDKVRILQIIESMKLCDMQHGTKCMFMLQAAGVKETAFQIDPKELERRQQELEEKRLADIRAHGTPVTIDTFAAWKASHDTERQSQRAQVDPESINRDKGPSGKAFFLAQEASGQQVLILSTASRRYRSSSRNSLH